MVCLNDLNRQIGGERVAQVRRRSRRRH